MKFASTVLFFAILTTTPALGFEQQPTAAKKTGTVKKAVVKKTAPAAASTKKGGTVTNKTATNKTATNRAPARKGAARSAAVRQSGPPRQALPTSDRYKEIQAALASKGYLKSEPTGVWDADSVSAMRQFQTDRKLDPSGKLTAASLIDLGLGPATGVSNPSPAVRP